MEKRKKTKPLLILFIIAAAFALLAAAGLGFIYGYSSHIEKNQAVINSAFSVNAVCDGRTVTVNSWENPKDGRQYVFLPGNADTDSLTVGGEKLAFGGAGEYSVKSSGKSYKTVILQGSDIPSLHIDTDGTTFAELSADKHNKSGAKLTVLADGEALLFGKELKYIKGRGNASWNYPQKSFNIKFKKKQDLLGLGEAKKYSLIALYTDQTLMKNDVAYSFAENIGLEYTPGYMHIDLYLNGDYMGCYLLAESVTVGNSRVAINDLEEANEFANPGIDLDDTQTLEESDENSKQTLKWSDIKGGEGDGYLLELDNQSYYSREPSGFRTSHGQTVVIRSPEHASKEQAEYISGFYAEFEEALYSPDGINSAGKSYLDYIDSESFAKAYLVQEFSQNKDASQTSCYMYLDGSGRLKAGPVWDFDNAFGNQYVLGNLGYADRVHPKEWTAAFVSNSTEYDGFFNLLFRHGDFRQLVTELWSAEAGRKAHDSFSLIEQTGVLIENSAVMNALRWNRYNTTDIDANKKRFEQRALELQDFITKRLEMLDGTLTGETVPVYYYSNTRVFDNCKGDVIAAGGSVILAECPFESYMKFTGWNTAPDGSGTAYAAGDEVTPDGSLVLYAQWENGTVTKLTGKVKRLWDKTKESLRYRISEISG